MVAKKPRPNQIERRPVRAPEMTEEEFMARLKEWPEKVDELIEKHMPKMVGKL
jgi:hypothetical protein